MADSVPWITISHSQSMNSIRFLGSSHVVAYGKESRRPLVWPLDVPGLAREHLSRELTPWERAQFSLENHGARGEASNHWQAERLARELELALKFSRANPTLPTSIVATRAFDQIEKFVTANKDSNSAKRCVELVTQSLGEGSSQQATLHAARLQATVGDLHAAVKTLERGMERFPYSLASRRFLGEYREQLGLDLPSFTSIDVALDEPAKLIPAGAEWRYAKGTAPVSETPLGWTEPEFDDSIWPSGKSGFGYGDDDDVTLLTDMRTTYSTVFVRKNFDVPNPAIYGSYRLTVHIDDGFVAYLNGSEIGRSGAGTEGEVLLHDALATKLVEASAVKVVLPIDADLVRGASHHRRHHSQTRFSRTARCCRQIPVRSSPVAFR